MKKITLLLTAVFVFSAASLYAQSAQTRLNNGKRLFDQENYDGAIREFTEAIKLDPNLAEAYAYRARAYVGDNNDQALSDANKAIQLNSRLAMGYIARGNVYRNKKDYTRAIADYNEAIKLEPRNALAYTNRGTAYRDQGDLDRAITDYTEAIRLEPTAQRYANRAYVYSNYKNDYDRAIADYTQAIRLNPNYDLAYFNRGLNYDRKKDYDRAIADYEAALRINPNDSSAKTNLAAAQKDRSQLNAQGGVWVTLVSEEGTRATFNLENTTSQTKRVLIVIQMSYKYVSNPVIPRDGGIQNSPEYTLKPNEKRQVVVPLPQKQLSPNGEPWIRSISVREIIVN